MIFGKTKKKLNQIAQKIETIKINEYVELMASTKKLLWKNFIAGISKGIGFAIGFSILGAIVILILYKLLKLNIPVVGNWIADIIAIIEMKNK